MSPIDSKGTPIKQLAVRVPVSLHERLERIALGQHRTVSQEVRRMLEEQVSEAELKEAA